MRRVLLSLLPKGWDPAGVRQFLQEHDCTMTLQWAERHVTEDELLKSLADVDGVVTGGHPYTRRVLEALPKLKVISRTGAGYDSIDLKAATDLGIMVTTTPGANSDSVADFAIGLLLAVVRRVTFADTEMRAGRWTPYMSPEVHGKTIGILGLGDIGRRVAKRARGFDMTILAHDPYPNHDFANEFGVHYVPVDELLRESDFVTIHSPLTPETHGLFDEAAFRTMKTTAYIVNTARGQVIDETSLIRALNEGWIAGAGLDVFEEEPLTDSPLRNMGSVVLSSHIAGWTHEAWQRMVTGAAEHVVDVLEGRTPTGLVNKDCVARA